MSVYPPVPPRSVAAALLAGVAAAAFLLLLDGVARAVDAAIKLAPDANGDGGLVLVPSPDDGEGDDGVPLGADATPSHPQE